MSAKTNSLREYWQVLRKRRYLALVVSGGIFGIVLLSNLLATPIYEGAVQIIIERVEPDNLSGSNRATARDPEFDKTQFQLIRSHAVARRVVSILGLEENYDAIQKSDGPTLITDIRMSLKEWTSILTGLFNDSSTNEEKLVEVNTDHANSVAARLVKNVRVQPVQESHITSISYLSPNPEFAALVANTYIKAYLEETLEMKMDATRRNLEWMTEKAESERLKLQKTENRLQEYMEANNLLTLEDRVTIIPETLSQLGGDLVRAETRTKEHKLLYDKVMRVSSNLDAAENVLSISEGSSLDVLRAQILRAEQNIMELSSKYGSKHPVMIKAQGDLGVLKKKRRQEIHRIIEKVRSQYELALSNENSIRGQLNETKSEALAINAKYVQYSELKRELDTNRQLYDALLTKIKDQSITGETRPVNIWVVEEAKVPEIPVKPTMVLNTILGLFVGLTCGVGVAFLVDSLDNRIKSAEGVGEALDVPVLGSVSFNRDAESMNQIVCTAPRSEYAESFNALRTTLMMASAEAPPKRILVASSVSGEGKTTTAVNLAFTMAKAGSRVLLIDADLRKPRLHKVFKLRNRIGLSSYLSGITDKSILCKTTHDNLVVVTSGPIPPNPYELLNSKRMEILLENSSQDFDVIICDTAPVLSVSDSRLLSRVFDGLILVMRAGKTTYPMAQACIKSLRDVNARIFGVLVNAVQLNDQEDYYRYYSSYLEETEKPDIASARTALNPAISSEK
ncbi:MAG: polysaccharide biosynthesis tyrosine autokinase [Desulfuromonadales bacterium]|nr:polysaccharide biosynthesis tyrosine autokinase [Desulfuromonadales bacterium]